MLVVNLFAGPGAGKSTTMAGVFNLLKLAGVNAEFAHEFAKDLTWEGRHGALSCQPYVFGKQLMKLQRLQGNVDVVVTDSPLLLSSVYAPSDFPQAFHEFVVWQFNQFNNLNFLLSRTKEYNPKGRNQTLGESLVLDSEIYRLLRDCGVEHGVVAGGGNAAKFIAEQVLSTLRRME